MTLLLIGIAIGIIVGTVVEHFNTRCPRRYSGEKMNS